MNWMQEPWRLVRRSDLVEALERGYVGNFFFELGILLWHQVEVLRFYEPGNRASSTGASRVRPTSSSDELARRARQIHSISVKMPLDEDANVLLRRCVVPLVTYATKGEDMMASERMSHEVLAAYEHQTAFGVSMPYSVRGSESQPRLVRALCKDAEKYNWSVWKLFQEAQIYSSLMQVAITFVYLAREPCGIYGNS